MHDTVSLAHRICSVESPIRKLFSYELSQFIVNGARITGTIIDRLLSYGLSPTSILLSCDQRQRPVARTTGSSRTGRPPRFSVVDGVVDSLAALLASPNFNRPNSREHTMVRLLTRF